MERSAQKVVPHFRLLVSEHSCRYYNILSDRVLFLTENSVVLSILLPKFIDWVLIMKWSNDSLWLMSYGKYFDHEMVEWHHMENILTMRWSNDFIRHLPYNETWMAPKSHCNFVSNVRQMSYEIIRPSHGQNIFHMTAIIRLFHGQNIFHTTSIIMNHSTISWSKPSL